MKKIILIFPALLAFFACQKESASNEQPQDDKNKVETITFQAVVVEEVIDADTKASISRGGVFNWAEDDTMKFYDEAGFGYDAIITDVDEVGVATIEVQADPGTSFVTAIYPASAAVNKEKVNLNTRGPIVVSKVTSRHLTFYHIGSIINVKFTNIPGDVNLVIEPESAFGYDGTLDMDDNPVLKATTATTSSIVVPISTADNGNDISVTVPNISLAAGTVIGVKNGNGHYLYKKASSQARDLSTNPTLLNVKAIDIMPMFYLETTVESGKPDFWSQANMPFIRTGAATYSLTVNADRLSQYNIKNGYNEVIKSATATTSDTYSNNTFSIIGGWNSWALTNSAKAMNKIGDWNYILNVSGLHNTEFKFNPWGNTDDWTQPWGFDGKDAAWFSISGSINTLAIAQNKSNLGLWYDADTDKPVDIYFNTSTKSGQCYVAAYKGNPLTSLIQFDINVLTEEVNLTIKDQGLAYPFGDTNFPTTLCIAGDFNSWADIDLSYSNNCWYASGLSFKSGENHVLLKKKDEWVYKSGWGAGFSEVLFGSMKGVTDESTDNLLINVPNAGTYCVYVNATSTTNYYNVMFVKQ